MGKMTEKLEDYMVKCAEKDDYSFFEKKKGVVGAMSADQKPKVFGVTHPELKRRKRDRGLATAAGAGTAGGGASALFLRKRLLKSPKTKKALIAATALASGLGGLSHGRSKAEKKWLSEKGINTGAGGLLTEFSPEARRKYLETQR